MAAQDISTLVLQVKSDGITDGASQLNDLTAAATKAEAATKALASASTSASAEVKKASGSAQALEAATSKSTGSAKAMADVMDNAAKASSRLTLEQRKQVFEYNESAKAYKAAAIEAYKINAAMDANATANATALKAADGYDDAMQRQIRSMMKLQMQANAMNAEVDKAPAARRAEAIAIASGTAALDANTKGHGSNAGAIREGMVLLHELSQGSYKRFGGSLMVLSNQMDLIPKSMELLKTGAIGTIAAYAGLAVGALALVGAIGLIAVATMQGNAEWKHYNDALILTNGYAGATAGGLREMSHQVAAVGGTAGNAKEAVTALAMTGKFTADQIKLIATSASLMEEAFGIPIDKTIKEFEELATRATTSTARSTNAVTQHVMKLNDQYHIVNAAQLEEISTLEKSGQVREAINKAEEIIATEQTKRAEASIANLGTIARAYREIKKEISGVVSAIGEWGKSDTGAQLNYQKKLRASAADDSNVTGANRVAALAMFDAKIATLQARFDKEQQAAQKKSDDVQTDQDRGHAGERLRVLVEANDKHAKMVRALAEFDADVALQSDETRTKNAKAYAIARAKIEADGVIKPVAGSDTRATDRDAEVEHIKAVNQDKITAIDGYITLVKERAKKEGENRWAALSEEEAYYDDERKLINDALTKELAVYAKFKSKPGVAGNEERAENERKNQAVKDNATAKLTGVDRDAAKAREDTYAAEEAEMDKLEKKNEQYYKAESKRVNDEIAAGKLRLAGIVDLKSAKFAEAATKEDSDADQAQKEYDIRLGLLNLMEETGLWTGRKAAIEEDGLKTLAKTIQGHRELAEIDRKSSAGEKEIEDFKRTTKYLDDSVAASKRFEKALSSAFGNVGKAIGGVSVSFMQMMKDKNTAQEQYNSLSKAEQDTQEAKTKLSNAQADAEISGYANMADAAKGFFNEKSKGYQIADGIAKGFHVAEMARNGVEMVSNIATGTSKMFAQLGAFAWPAIAAMAATMAAFGISVGTSHNGGGQSAADVQKAQGTGSVFGDSTAKSDSISKSIDALKDNAQKMLPVSESMLKSLQNIEAAMTGLTNLVVRTTGVTDGSNMGIKTGTTSQGAGGVVGTALGVISSVPVLGTVLNKLVSFWGKTTQNIVDSGIKYGGTVGSLEQGQGYNQYASVDTTKSSWFGLSKSTSNNVQTQGLSTELSQQFGLIFSNLQDTLVSAAGALGKDGSAVGKAIQNMVIDTTTVSLKGLTGDDLTKAINAVISKTMDDIASAAFPQMDAFRQVGEGYAQTVVRVATGIESANAALKTLGITAINYTDIQDKASDVGSAIVEQSIALKEAGSGVGKMIEYMSGTVDDLTKAYSTLVAARSQMKRLGLGDNLTADTVTGAGGSDALTSALATYQSQYFTAVEQVAAETSKVTDQFNAIGKALPASREELRAWITAAAAAGDQSMVGKLLAVADSFDKLQTSVEDVKESDVKNAKDALDSALTTASNAFDALQTIVNTQKDAINKAKDATQTVIDNMTDMLGKVTDALKTTAPTVDDARAFQQAMQVVSDSIAAVQNGADVSKMKGLDDALSTISSHKTDGYSTQLDFSRAQAKANALLLSLQNAGTGQLTSAQKALVLEQAQLDTLDTQLKAASDQLDALKGIDISIKTLAQALSNFGTAVTNAAAVKAVSDSTAAGTGVSGEIDSLYRSLLNRPADAAGKAFYTDAITNKGQSINDVSASIHSSNEYAGKNAAGTLDTLYQSLLKRPADAAGSAFWAANLANGSATVDQITKAIMDSKEYKAAHPSFAVGTNYVPNDMLANIHQGERIIPAADNAKMMEMMSGNGSMSNDSSALMTKMDTLIDVIQRGDVANVQRTGELVKIIKQWDGNGQPPTRSDQ